MVRRPKFIEKSLSISTPGRICLFGEHQDYLKLPVIAAAISRRIVVEGTNRRDKKITIDLPDIQRRESFEITRRIPYERERDYFRSVMNVLQRRGFRFSHGFDCSIHGNIPINAGTASSSALTVGWTNFLSRMSDEPRQLNPEETAALAYEAEVLEFAEPGGMMDHYSTAQGGVIWLESYPEMKILPIDAKLKSFVLGNSSDPKDTKFILANVKNRILGIVKRLREQDREFSLHTVTHEDLKRHREDLDESERELLAGTIRNRDITFEARRTFGQRPLNHRKIGDLLNEHQSVLRDVQKISTPKINRMIEAALAAGAYGAKINGSGGGGCMFAYAPDNAEAVADAVRSVSEATVVQIDSGSREVEGSNLP